MIVNTLAHDTQNIRPLDLHRERVEDITKTANAWLAKVPEIKDEETAKRAADFLEQIDKEINTTNGRLTLAERAEKAPLREQIATIGAAYEPLVAMLKTAKGLLNPKLAAWLGRKRAQAAAEKRKQQEEAARLAQEAIAAANLARKRNTVENTLAAQRAIDAAESARQQAEAPVERVQVRGNYSSRARSIRTLWRAQIEDQDQVYLLYREHLDVRELLQRLANADAPAAHKANREIPGCVLYPLEITA